MITGKDEEFIVTDVSPHAEFHICTYCGNVVELPKKTSAAPMYDTATIVCVECYEYSPHTDEKLIESYAPRQIKLQPVDWYVETIALKPVL